MSAVSVIGLGKLGACMAASMARRGHHVIGVDKSARNVDLFNSGKSPVIEPHLAETIAQHRARLRATTSTADAITETDLTFVIVPTPSDEAGGFSLTYVREAMTEIGRALRRKAGYHLVVLTSTVLPGASRDVVVPLLEQESGKTAGAGFGYCYNPEFIALGSVLHDLVHPDFILIGEQDARAGDKLEAFYRTYLEKDAPYARMTPVNAELTKIAVNTYVTTKITFANALAHLCSSLPGGDVDKVSEALGLDARIGRRYLRGALSYGGPCFPRDNRAFTHLARSLGAVAPLADATDQANRALTGWHVNWVKGHLRPGHQVAILGMAYKPDTPVVEESASIAMARHLVEGGHPVLVFDPLALDGVRAILGESVRYADSVAECLARADVVVIANPCSEWRSLTPADFPRRIVVLDCWRFLRSQLEGSAHVDYHALGIGPQ